MEVGDADVDVVLGVVKVEVRVTSVLTVLAGGADVGGAGVLELEGEVGVGVGVGVGLEEEVEEVELEVLLDEEVCGVDEDVELDEDVGVSGGVDVVLELVGELGL